MNTNDLVLGLEKKNAEIMAMNISNEDKRILLNFYYDEYKMKKQQFEFNNLFNFQPIMEALPIMSQMPVMKPMPIMSQIPVMKPMHQQNMCNINQNNPNSNYNATSYSFSQQLNPNGTYTVREHNKINNNGHIDSKFNNYHIDANGNIFR